MYGLEGDINVYSHFRHLFSYIAVDKIVASETAKEGVFVKKVTVGMVLTNVPVSI
jgi:hypothetical protein